MLKTSEKVETNIYQLEITIDGETFEEAVNKAYLKQRKNIAVKGFRKGKAPRNFIEKMYGESVFYEDALELIYPDAVSDAIKEAGLDIVDMPYDFEVPEIGKNGVTMKLKVTVKPEIKLGEYKGLAVTKPVVKVSADEVKTELANMQEQNSRMVSVEDRPVENGDTVVIDFEGFVDGVAFEGGKAESHNLVIGSNQFIPGFEEQIIGHNTNDEFDINVTFPENYQEDLASKDAVFKIKLHDIRKKELPELDDEFVKDVSEFDTLDQLKKHIKSDLETAKKTEADNKVTSDLLEAVTKGIEVEIPAVMIEKEIDNLINDFSYRLQAQGLDLNTYLMYTGMEKDAFRDGFKENAENQVKLQLALEAIVKAENIEVTEEELNEEYDNLAKTYNMEAEVIKKSLSEDAVKGDIVNRKAVELIKANAVITEEKTAAKKTAKKKADNSEKEEEKPAAKKTSKKKADEE